MFKKKTFCFDKKNGFYEKLGRKIKCYKSAYVIYEWYLTMKGLTMAGAVGEFNNILPHHPGEMMHLELPQGSNFDVVS